MKGTYPIEGMSCAACAASVESILINSPGVKEASVNFANKTAWVDYDPAVTQPLQLKKAVQAVGYDLIVVQDADLQNTTESIQQQHLTKTKRQALGAGILSLPVVVIGMFFMNMPYGNYIMLVLSAPVVFGFGLPFFVNAYRQATHGRANMDTLVALSTGIAFMFSAFNTLLPLYWHKQGLHAHVYYEAAAVIITFVSLGKWLEEKAKIGTSTALKHLIGLQPTTVKIIAADGTEKEIDTVDVSLGEILIVKPGERIPVDGEIVLGSSFIDESSITGEPMPTSKAIGHKVFAGTVNQQGLFHFRAEKVGKDTVLAQIVQRVQQAQGSKAPVQKLVDKVAGIFVPVVLGVALLTFIAWITFGGDNAFSHGLMASITVLVIACPCALGLATPTAIMVGIGKAAESNILIKDAESLELAHQVDALVVDKTGTLTEGQAKVQEIHWIVPSEETLSIMYSLEKASSHPLAKAITRHLASTNPKMVTLDSYVYSPGRGSIAYAQGTKYLIGNKTHVEATGTIVPEAFGSLLHSWYANAYTVVYFASEEGLLAIIAITDPIKRSSEQAIKELQSYGIEVYMLTGDNPHTAHAVARQLGIAHVQAAMLPADKAAFILNLQAQGKKVAMAGDGINDSHALAQADVSIAMGKGSDLAIEVAKITLLTSDLLAIPRALRLSTLTVRTIRQNLFWAFVYNAIGIPIAAGLLYPSTGFLLNPMVASAAMALSSTSVVCNSLLLKMKKL